jgi:hypothetical protein
MNEAVILGYQSLSPNLWWWLDCTFNRHHFERDFKAEHDLIIDFWDFLSLELTAGGE